MDNHDRIKPYKPSPIGARLLLPLNGWSGMLNGPRMVVLLW